MRIVELSDGRSMAVRPLTRREIKALGEYGFRNMFYAPPEDRAKAEEGFDRCLNTQFTEEELQDLPNPDIQALFLGIIAETYAIRSEEKNSKRSGATPQTQSGSRTVTDAEKATSARSAHTAAKDRP